MDRREDELYGRERSDELPENLRTREGRRKALGEAKERLERERQRAVDADDEDDDEVVVELDPRQFVDAAGGPARVGARGPPRAGDSMRARGPPDPAGAHRSSL